MPNRRRWMRQVGTVKVPLKGGDHHYQLFFYTVDIAQDGYFVVEQQPDTPTEATEANVSSFVLFDFMFHLTWICGKPVPNSETRRQGILAVYDDILNRMPPESRAAALKLQFGIGHIPSEAITFMSFDDVEGS